MGKEKRYIMRIFKSVLFAFRAMKARRMGRTCNRVETRIVHKMFKKPHGKRLLGSQDMGGG
jgi:hypothetical protein